MKPYDSLAREFAGDFETSKWSWWSRWTSRTRRMTLAETGLYGNLPELNSLTVVKLDVALQENGSRSRSRSTRSSV